MPRWLNSRLPSYRLHKQSGQAIVTLNSRDYSLGPHHSTDSVERYNRLTSKWLARGRRAELERRC